MRSVNRAGFTIIETMLFLGISGLLIMGVLTGVGVSINIQRYRDSVVSLQSVLQQQFNEVANPINVREGNDVCEADGSDVPIGQSDCVLIGKYITTVDDKNILIRNVIGYNSNPFSAIGTDTEVLQAYNIKVTNINSETYQIEWGSSVNEVRSNNPINFSILIAKSPQSGLIKTYTTEETVADSNIGNIIDTNNLKSDLIICVNSNGMFAGNKMAVKLGAGAANASSVETLGDASKDNPCNKK